MKARTVFAALVLLALSAGAALARPDDAGMRDKVRDKIRTLRTAKLIEYLDLDEATAAKLFPILNKYDDQMAPIRKDQGEARRELRKALQAPKPDNAALNKLIDRAVADREKLQKLEGERTAAVRKVLTPVQMAKAVVALPEVDRFIEKQIQKALRRQANGAGRPGGKGGADPLFPDDDDID